MWPAIAFSLVLNAISFILAAKPPKPRNAVAASQDSPAPPQGKPKTIGFGPYWKKDPGVLYFGNTERDPIKSGGGGKK